MPLYEFECEKGNRFTQIMSISEKEKLIESKKGKLKQILSAPSIVSGTDGIKNDDGWKENLSRIAEAHPDSALADQVGGRSPAKAKVADIAKKHGLWTEAHTIKQK